MRLNNGAMGDGFFLFMAVKAAKDHFSVVNDRF
jgi:hypothetical protein